MCGQSKKFYWEGHLDWEQEDKGPPENSSATVLGFMVMGLVLWWWVVFSQSFWLRVLAGGACLVQPRQMPEIRILGSSRICGVSFWPFLNSSWWWLISSVFLTRTSCGETTHANGYYGARPGWVVQSMCFPSCSAPCLLCPRLY